MGKDKPTTSQFKNFAAKHAQQIHKVKDAITGFATVILLAASTITAIYYIRGYRVDPDGGVRKTGVISINTSPSRSTIRIDGEEIGKSPKTLATVEPGVHTVVITRDGYITWEKEITVVEGKATPIYAYLFKDDVDPVEVLTLENDVVTTLTDEQKENIFIMTEKDVTGTEPGSPAQKLVRVWQFRTDPFIWENANNPDLIFEETYASTTTLAINPSPDGTFLLLVATDALEQVTYSIIDPYTVILNAPELPQSLQELIVSIEWNQDSDSLIVETEEFIIQLHVPNFAQNILLTKDDTVKRWSTDLRGSFYYTSLITPETPEVEEGEEAVTPDPYYSILRDAGTDQEVIEEIYFVDTDQYLDEDTDLYKPFIMSPESPRLAGEIESFYVDTTANTIIIKSDFALYHYNIDTQEFTLISADEHAQFHAINPDKESLLYTDSQGISVFTFDKEEADYITEIGSKLIVDTSHPPHFLQWHTESANVLFGDDNGIYSVDIDGDNNQRLVDTPYFATSDASGEVVFNLFQKEDGSVVLHRREVR